MAKCGIVLCVVALLSAEIVLVCDAVSSCVLVDIDLCCCRLCVLRVVVLFQWL